ncbi:MAG TPA: hypothetical protein VFJ20_07295 [Gemmatimonadaceae bacterium]|nr:hypothetical protein [Gemmatimonadaceae bacterium]
MLGVACHRGNVQLPTLAASGALDTAQLAARGEYIVRNVAACGTCHAPDHNPDGALSGGMEFKDWRLGTVRSANITPDSATGIGTWTDAEIVRAIRTGERKDGRLLAPLMPYEWFHEMSDQDAFAVARYLETQPPVRHAVRQSPDLAFKLARSLFLGPKRGTPASAPPRAPTAEYGAYLSQHIGLCAECHTPRSGLENASDRNKLFAGQAHPPKDFPANPANLTPDSATGLGRWSEPEFLATIRTGTNPAGYDLNSFMPWRQVRRMTDGDLRAIYRYLRTLKPVRNEIGRGAARR